MTIAKAEGGQILRDYGGRFWPVSDFVAGMEQCLYIQLGHHEWAEQLRKAREDARTQRAT